MNTIGMKPLQATMLHGGHSPGASRVLIATWVTTQLQGLEVPMVACEVDSCINSGL